MSKILPYYRRCFYTHSKSTQTLSSRKCAGIVVMYEGLIYHETYNEPWLYTRWRCQNFIPVEKGGKCRNILRELMYMIMTNKGYFWTWPFNFICYKTRPNPFTIQTKIRILTKQKQRHAPAKFRSLQRWFWKTKETSLILPASHESMYHLASPLSCIIDILEGVGSFIWRWRGKNIFMTSVGAGGMRNEEV